MHWIDILEMDDDNEYDDDDFIWWGPWKQKRAIETHLQPFGKHDLVRTYPNRGTGISACVLIYIYLDGSNYCSTSFVLWVKYYSRAAVCVLSRVYCDGSNVPQRYCLSLMQLWASASQTWRFRCKVLDACSKCTCLQKERRFRRTEDAGEVNMNTPPDNILIISVSLSFYHCYPWFMWMWLVHVADWQCDRNTSLQKKTTWLCLTTFWTTLLKGDRRNRTRFTWQRNSAGCRYVKSERIDSKQ